MAEQPPAPVFHVEQRPNPRPRALVMSVFLCCVTTCAVVAQRPDEPPKVACPPVTKARPATHPHSRSADARAPVFHVEQKVVIPGTIGTSADAVMDSTSADAAMDSTSADAREPEGVRHPQP